MTSVANKLGDFAAYLYERCIIIFRRLLRFRKAVTRSVAFVVVVVCGLWIARETYYKRTEPRIDPGRNIVVLSPSSYVRPQGYAFTLELLDFQAGNVSAKSGWWARLKPGHDRNSRTEATSVTIHLLGPGANEHTFRLDMGKAAVYPPGDAILTFVGMYSGCVRMLLERYSRTYTSELTLSVGDSSELAGTNLIVGVGNPAVSDPREMSYTVAVRGEPQTAIEHPAAVGAAISLNNVEVEIVRILPNHVTFKIRNKSPFVNANMPQSANR